MHSLQIIPPQLKPYTPERYYRDIEYRTLIDLEHIGERHERLMYLFGNRSEL
jgi:hypothetical protein